MKISVYHAPEEFPTVTPEAPGPACAIAIDVLRATTTMCCALEAGAGSVQAFSDLDELMATSEGWPAEKRVRIGERGGKSLKPRTNNPEIAIAHPSRKRRLKCCLNKSQPPKTANSGVRLLISSQLATVVLIKDPAKVSSIPAKKVPEIAKSIQIDREPVGDWGKG